MNAPGFEVRELFLQNFDVQDLWYNSSYLKVEKSNDKISISFYRFNEF